MIDVLLREIDGWRSAVHGMRNPLNSWAKSDSYVSDFTDDKKCGFIFGRADHDLAMRLVAAGSDHAKFRRMIVAYMDITAPLYWWKEFDTYKVGTVANSCSTMHKIHEKEFTFEDFSCEHLYEMQDIMKETNLTFEKIMERDLPVIIVNYDGLMSPRGILGDTIRMLNRCRDLYLQTNDKNYWWQMIQLLPSSYNQMRTVMLNYEVLANMYKARKNHKLDEWRTFCAIIEDLPYSELITG